MVCGQAVFAGPPKALLADEAVMVETGLAQVWPSTSAPQTS